MRHRASRAARLARRTVTFACGAPLLRIARRIMSAPPNAPNAPNARARDVVGWAKVCGARAKGAHAAVAHGGAAAQGIIGRCAHGTFWNDDADTLTVVGGITAHAGAREVDRTCMMIKFGACAGAGAIEGDGAGERIVVHLIVTVVELRARCFKRVATHGAARKSRA